MVKEKRKKYQCARFCPNTPLNYCFRALLFSSLEINIFSPSFPAKAGKKPVPKKTEKSDDAGKTARKAPVRQVQKAQKVQKKVVKGTHGTRVKKVRTTVHFKRPRTFRPARNPKFPRRAIPKRNR